MHDIVVDQLDRHLEGQASSAFYSHLDICPECRLTVESMDQISACVRELAFTGQAEVQPSPGFYARVASQVVERESKQAWGLFSPGFAFFRRVAFASLLLLAGLGGFLVTREADEGGTDAAFIMAQHDVLAIHAEGSDRDRLLVTLANYK